MLRRRGGTCRPRSGAATSSPPIEIVPPVGCSRPAMQRNVVVLPQPEGPSPPAPGGPTRPPHPPRRDAEADIVDRRAADEKLLAQMQDDQLSRHVLASLPVPIDLVPLVEPALLQLHE